MKLGSREADEAYDRWHDRLADGYFGANEDDACEICGGDQDAMNELTADAERFRALRDMSDNFAWRYAEAKRNGLDLEDAITADLPAIPGVVAILNAEDFTAAVDELMRSNANVTGLAPAQENDK
jgi:hypothetical protein